MRLTDLSALLPQGFPVLFSAGAAANAIGIAVLPLLARVYSPAEFGLFGTVMAIVSVAVVIVHGRYHLAIPLVDEDRHAAQLVVLSATLSLVLAMPTALLFGTYIYPPPDEISFSAFVGAVSVLIILSAILEVIAYWRSRLERFSESARDQIFRISFGSAVQLALVQLGGAGLVLGTMAGLFGAASLGVLGTLRRDTALFLPCKWRFLRNRALQYKRYPMLSVPQGLVAAISWNALPLLLLRYGGAELTGLYWMAYRLYMAPLSVFNSAYRQSALTMHRESSVDASRAIVLRHTVFIFFLGVGPLCVVFVFGSQIFQFMFGEAWAGAGSVAGWLAIGVLADFAKVPSMCYLLARGRQAELLAWEMVQLGLRYGATVPLLMSGHVNGAIPAFSVLGFLGWTIFIVQCLWPSQRFRH